MSPVRVEYRPTPEDGFEPPLWQFYGEVEPGADFVIDDLLEDVEYEVRAREVLEGGSLGPWTPVSRQLAVRGNATGATGDDVDVQPPSNLRVEDDGCLHWDAPDVDDPAAIAGYEVSTAPDYLPEPDVAQQLGGGLVADTSLDLCAAPRGERTFMVRTVLANGEKSEPALIQPDRGPYDEGHDVELETHDEGPAWTGTQTNLAPSAGVLLQVLEARAYGDPGAPAYGPAADFAYGPRPALAIYKFQVLVAEDAPAERDGRILTLDPDIQAPGWRIEYRLADAPAYGRADAPAYGAAGDPAYGFLTEDGPAYGDPDSPAYGAPWELVYGRLKWRPWPGKLFLQARAAIDVRVVLPARAGSTPGQINALRWRVTRPPALGTEIAELEDGKVPPDQLGNGSSDAKAVLHHDGGWKIPPAGMYPFMGSDLQVTNLGAAKAEIPAAARIPLDLTYATDVRLVGRVSTSGQGNAFVEYSLDETTWTAITPTVSLNTTGTKSSAWTALSAAAKAEVVLRIVTNGGNGADDPVLAGFGLQVR